MLTKNEINLLLKICEKLTMPVEQARYVIKVEDKLQVMLETAPDDDKPVEENPKDAVPERVEEPAEEVPTS